ncbi:MAG: molecular chaperone DnaJ [Clostridiales bacterium]|jgi:molecular chaperone DnaJ|nr:molecular chaperone DnaJ [Clostridiales bacterium]
MADKKDYYEVLGVPRDISAADLKKAYRKLASKYHPDNNPGDSAAETKFKELNEAYEVLSDEGKRNTYNQFGHSAFDGSAGAGGGGFEGGFNFSGDMGDIFESVFGAFGGGGRRRNAPQKGASVSYNMQITFEESYRGGTKNVTLPVIENCPECGGGGAKKGTVAENCKKCGGTGRERAERQTFLGVMIQETECSSCRGRGKIIKTPCPVCDGLGRVRQQKTLQITIPRGIDSGQRVSIAGKGQPGERGGPYGDLLINFYVKPHDKFKRNGLNLHIDAPLSFAQAALGDEIEIPTMEGVEKYTVKPGTQPNTTAIIRGRGMPNVSNNRQFGDLVVNLSVTVPVKLTEKQKQKLREFDEELSGEAENKGKKGIFGKK